MARVRCKCSKRTCRARKTLAQHPDLYETPPKCHIGGCDGHMRPDANREKARKCRITREKSIAILCYCDGLFFSIRNCPHGKGSPGCVHYVDKRNLVELYEEYEEYEAQRAAFCQSDSNK